MSKHPRPGNPGYSDEEKDEIIAHVLVNVACGRFVSRVFREDQTTATGVKMPNAVTFWKWCLLDETGELDKKLADARAKGIEALLDQTVDIADETQFDTIVTCDDEGNPTGEKPNKEWMARSKLRIETRVKLAQMMKPKTYGPKLDVTSDGQQLGVTDALDAARRRAEKALDAKGDK
jgi:hypothetical protein